MSGNYIGPWLSLLISLGISVLAYFIANTFSASQNVAVAAIFFTVSNTIFGLVRESQFKKKLKNHQIPLLKELAKSQITQGRRALKHKAVEPIVDCLANIEFILAYICDCCDDSDRFKFKKIKGRISTCKTTYSSFQQDKSITPPKSNTIQYLSDLETYLTELKSFN